ncbi:MAG: amino acid adenylation domain-containing protein, partial [Longimicrobiaceae bacterium]
MKLTPEQLENLSPARRALLEKMLAERSGAKRAAAAPADIPRRAGSGPVPLSFAQQRLWFIHQLDPRSPAYNMPAGMRLRGPLDPRSLRRALGEIVRRHEALRTVFAASGEGEPVQVVLPPAPARLPAVDLSGLAPRDRERETGRLGDAESAHPFDLARGPLLRSALLVLDPADHVVLFTMHHIVSDGWSMGVLVREVSELYAAFAAGLPSPLPELPVQYADFALWQREHLSGRRLEEQLEFWRARLAGAPPLLELPTDRPRGPVEDPAGTRLAFVLSPELSAAVPALARSEGATLFMALLAGLQLTLSRWSGQDDVVVGSPIAGRTRVELEGLIGFFVNTLVLRTDLGGDPTARELLARVRRGVLEAQSNQEFPFERLVEEVQPERTLAHSPLFQVLLSLQNVDSGSLQLGAGLELEPIPSTLDTAKFDLSWTMEEIGGVVAGGVSYRRSLWEGATVQRIVDHFRAVLAGMVAHPDRPVSRIELLTGAEREQVLRRWNDTAADYPVHGGLRALFEAQADRTPAAAAVAFGAESLTYAELDRRADALAARLVALGAGPDARVGLCVERSLELAVGVLGILKAGAACVPIDPAYPQERVAFMLEDAAVAVLLTQEKLVERLPATSAELVVLDGEAENDTSESEGQEALPQNWGRVASLSEPGGGLPDALAYVIYTSGSTGRPKGVAMPQRPLLNLLAWQLREWSGRPAARTLQFASLSFDVSFQEILSTWASGGTLLLVPEEVRADMPRLARFLAEEHVERIFLPFIALQHLAEAAEAEGIVPGSLREVVTAGEQLRVTEPIRRWLGRMPGCALVNQYGPSETHVVTALTLAGGAEGWPLLPGIGGPIANTQCYVLDGELRPAPVGIPGELYLGGDGVARGYLGRPALTAERFVPDPYGPRSGGRLYRPGDRARWLAGGELEFLGRTDQQVKVRGFRIEPGEVEAALEAHPAVGEAVVAVREDAPGDRRLVAYLVAAAGKAVPGGAELRAFLAARLPEYMVPNAFVSLASLPLTPSGKIDRRALPAPGDAAAEAGFVEPRTPTEAALAGIYAAVLRREQVGAEDGFFAMGGHSLLATRVVSRVRDAWGVELPLRALFEAPTVAALAARVDGLLREEEDASEAPPEDLSPDRQLLLRRLLRRRAGQKRETERVRPRGTGGPVPLSFAQQRLWFIDRMEPGSSAYNLPSALRLRGPLDGAVLRRTLAGVVRRHESLRTVFAEAADGPVQVVLPFAGAALPVADLSALPGEARERELLRLAADEAARPFDLARGPLLRSLLVRLGGDDHAVLFNMHHIVGDGWSNGVLVGEVSALYAALAGGRPSPLPPLPVQYPDYAVWQREWLSGERLEAQLGWWRERMAGAPPVLELPTDRPRPAVPDPRGATLGFELPAEVAAGLRELAAREGTTLFAVLLAGWQAVLARWSGQDDVVVGTPVAGRTRTELEGLIGFFVNTLVLRTELDGDPPLRELAARVGETTLDAQAHQDLPFERLVEELAPERSLQHTPLFQVLFTLQNADEGELRLGAVEMEPLGPAEGAAKFDLSLVLAERGDQVAGALLYRAALWEEATVQRMADHFRAALHALAAEPDRHLSAVDLLGEDERRLLVDTWSRSGGADAPAARCVHELFVEQAERTPGAVALVAGGEATTYAELRRRSAALARRLAARGVGPDARVGILVERGPEMVVGLLGVLMAGGAYVPLDPQYPAERLAYMLADAGVRLLLTQEPLRGRLPEFAGEVVSLDAEDDGAEDAGALAHPPSPENLAYVIYTSGSTGQPKGTEVPHRAIPGFFRGVDYARWDERVVVLQHSSVSWDVLTLELWPALLSGGTCVLYPGRTSEPAVLGEQVRAHGVNTLWLTAAYFNVVVDTAPEVLAGVEQLLVGGEAVSAPHARRALELYPELRLVDGYGPSETTVFAACFPVPAGFGGPSLPIGRPVGDRRVYLLDRHFGPAPLGAAGELCIGGPGVARGYLGRPGLTADRFVPDPFGEPGARLYRSGDRARWRADGRLEFLGRADFQVKIRGFRVEPGEVEAVLASHPAVREAAVTVHERAPGDRRLAGYVTAAEGAAPTPAELRAWLGERMPEHMVPGTIVVLDALPLTPHGKLDRRALPVPDAADDGEAYAAPRTPAEETLAGIWADVLGAERVGVHADFFALGGHSLLATRVTSRIRESFGVEMPVRALFESPTVAALAPRVEAALRAGTGAAEPAPPIAPVPRDGALPLSFAQQRLWLIDRMEPGSAAYNIPTPLRLRGALDARALRRALAEIVRRHEALRTVFAEADGEPVQTVRPAGPVALPVVELGGLPAGARERELRRLADAEGGRPFDLRRGPLLRAALLRAGDAEWALLLNVHHIVSDGWSTGILVGEFSALYGAFARGEPSPLPEPRVQYADFAAWQRAWLSGERLEAQLAFWREKLKGAPPALDLPTDGPRPAVPGVRGATLGFALTAEASAAVRALCRREGVTPFMALLAAWQLLLARYAATDDVSVGTAIAGRNRVELEGLVGFFVNTLVLRAELGGRPTVREVLRRVREATLGAFAHQDVPFERLVEELAPERSLRQAPLFQVMFSFQNVDAGSLELGALELAPLAWSGEAAKFDLSLTAREDGGRFGGFVTFRTDLFAPATVERMLEHFATLAAALADDPARLVAALPLMDAAERARVLEAAHGPTRAYPRHLSIHALFERQAARTPGAVAAVFDGGSWTYAELDRRAADLAHELVRRRLAPETRIGVFLERGPEWLAAMLAVLKAGAVYVPLDPSHPAERTRWVLEDSGASLLLTSGELRGRVPEFGGEIVVCDGTPLPPTPSPARGEGENGNDAS